MRRDSSQYRTVAVLGVVLAAAMLAGCGYVGDSADQPRSLPSGEEAATQAAQLTGVEKTLNVTLVRNGNVTWSVQRIATRPETGEFRNEILSQGPASVDDHPISSDSRIVSNGTVRYIYLAEEERVFRSEVTQESPNRSREVRRLFSAVGDESQAIQYPTPGVSSLPVVPAGSDADSSDSEATQWQDTDVVVEYNGTATVSGRTAYVLDLRPATDNSSLVESTLWLDTEYLYPVKSHRIVEQYGDRYEYTSRVENLTFNPTFPPGTFEFDPDTLDDATVVDSATYDSREEMVANLDRSVPDPEVPTDYGFESGFYADRDTAHLSMTYTNGSGDGVLRVSVFDEPANLTRGREISLDGRPAVISTFDDRRYLVWNQDGRQYSVSGSVDNGTLREVATSLVAE